MAKAIRSGRPLKPNKVIDYLFKKGFTKCLIDQSYDPNYHNVLEAFEHLARRVTLEVYDKLIQLQQQGQSYELAWNECAVDLCKVELRESGPFGFPFLAQNMLFDAPIEIFSITSIGKAI
jgi:hypothetical protein